MMRPLLALSCTVLLWTAASCEKDDGSGGGGGIEGVAHVIQGPTGAASAFAPRFGGPATDGVWYVSPDQVEVTLTRINFPNAHGSGQSTSELTNCAVVFDKADPSNTNLIDCPFTVTPGTYAGISAHFDGDFRVLINDSANGIFTDPASPTRLSTTAPAGGAAFVDYSRPLGDSAFEQPFVTPLVIETTNLSLALVMDGVQTLRVEVSGGGTALAFVSPDQIPVNIFPTPGDPGVARYFTTSGTAESYDDSLVLANILRLYFSPDGQPAFAMHDQAAGAFGSCSLPGPAFPGDPASSDFGAGAHGGWLGRDSTGTTCWASSRDEWQSYQSYLTITDVAVIGSSGTFSCDATPAPAPPSSGTTYASGCPPMTADATIPITLVAQ